MGRLEEDLHDDLLVRIAGRYYIDGLSQNEIAEAEHLSRPSVSRLLSEARSRGVVQFKVGRPVDRSHRLEAALLRAYPLRDCVVATGKPRALYGDPNRTGYVAARYLESQLSSVQQLGVASSRSLFALVAATRLANRPDLTIVDLLGCPANDKFDEDERAHTARLLAARLGAAFKALPGPFVHKSESARKAALQSQRVREALEIGPQSDMAIVGVGSMKRFDGTGNYSPVSRHELARLAENGAVGHICGHFLRSDGSTIQDQTVPVVLGIGADELRQIPRRIAIAAGEHKVAPIAVAVRGGYIAELITDESTASELLLFAR